MRSSTIEIFHANRTDIIEKWVHLIKTEVSDSYSIRPEEEIFETVTEAYESFISVLFSSDFNRINKFIEKITRMRLMAGFLLSDVQMAFEFFRRLSIPLLAKETSQDEFMEAIETINSCLTHTIHRFSNLFQFMQQERILQQNRQLEKRIRIRTAELRESEQRYKILVEEINDGFFVIHDEVLVFVNRATELMHGYQPAQMIGQRFYSFIDRRDRKKVMAWYYKSLQSKKTLPILEYLRLTRNGDSSPTEIFSKVTKWDGKTSVIGVCRDISARVQMEKKIRESERMADIGRITTSLSHEIRNPLSAVQMNLQILSKNPLLPGNDQKRINISLREVKRLEKILEELLDFAKPMHLKATTGSLNEVLLSAAELLEMKLESDNINLKIDLDPDLPLLCIDGQRINQAVLNLLLNAAEASAPGKQINLCSEYDKKHGEMVEVMVFDEGPGIPKNIIADIFKPFFTTKVKGTGLGLNNVERIAKAHGGRVKVQNVRPHGACFTLSIPVQ